MLVFYIEKEMHNAQFQTFCLAWHGMAARHEPIRWAVGTKLPSGCLLIKSFIQYLMSLLAGVRGACKSSRHYIQMRYLSGPPAQTDPSTNSVLLSLC